MLFMVKQLVIHQTEDVVENLLVLVQTHFMEEIQTKHLLL